MHTSTTRVVPIGPGATEGWSVVDISSGETVGLDSVDALRSILWPIPTEAFTRSEPESALQAEWSRRGWSEAFDHLLLTRGDTDALPPEAEGPVHSDPCDDLGQALATIARLHGRADEDGLRLGFRIRHFGTAALDGWADPTQEAPFVPSSSNDDRASLFGAFRAPFSPEAVALVVALAQRETMSPRSAMLRAGGIFRRVELMAEATGYRCAAHYGFDDDALARQLQQACTAVPLLAIAFGRRGQ